MRREMTVVATIVGVCFIIVYSCSLSDDHKQMMSTPKSPATDVVTNKFTRIRTDIPDVLSTERGSTSSGLSATIPTSRETRDETWPRMKTTRPIQSPSQPMSSIQRERLQLIENICHINDQKITTAKSIMYYYKEFNVSYCKVPKVGCTFMMVMFQYLTGHIIDIADMKRSSIHTKTTALTSKPKPFTPMLITARDPYSRLFSAYIDKFVLPLKKYKSRESILGKMTNTSETGCPNDITFQEFLDGVIKEAMTPGQLDRHWSPVSSICHLCETNNFMVIKQESFKDDVLEFVRRINVSQSQYDRVNELLTSKRVEITIPGIVQEVFNRKKWKRCISMLTALKELWYSFQVQGYIASSYLFEKDLFMNIVKSSTYNIDVVSDIFVKAAKTSNMTTDKSKEQRHEYLLRAYQSVSMETLNKIQHIFMFDFKMFDYNLTPPSRPRI